jgi:hypothetical protein
MRGTLADRSARRWCTTLSKYSRTSSSLHFDLRPSGSAMDPFRFRGFTLGSSALALPKGFACPAGTISALSFVVSLRLG